MKKNNNVNIKEKIAQTKEVLPSETPEAMVTKNTKSAVVYEDILPGIDLEYITKGESIKENIILKSKTSQNSISFIYDFNGLVPRLDEDKSITLLNPADITESGLVIAAPYMYDANYERSWDLDILIGKTGKEHKLTLIANKEWLEAKGRAYPVVIDPTLQTTMQTMAIKEAFVRQSEPNSSYYNNIEFIRTAWYNNGMRDNTYIRFTNMPVLKSSDQVVRSQLILMPFEKYSSDPKFNIENGFNPMPVVSAYQVLQTWDTGAMGSTPITYNTQPNCSTTVLDYQKINDYKVYEWDITKVTKSWYQTGSNFGVQLKMDVITPSSTWAACFTSSDYTNVNPGDKPSLIITYRNTSGLESYYSYHDQGVGRAGTGYVNDYTGNIVFVHGDAATTGNRLPSSANHVYGNDKRIDATTYNNDNIYPKYGNGWSVDAVQRLNSSGISDYPYKYTDGDGTEHYFYDDPSDSTVGPYLDEDGLGLKLQVFTAAQESLYWYSITDKEGTVLRFDRMFGDGGLLRRMTDKNGNRNQYNYLQGTSNTGTYYYLASLIDGADREITFGYNTNHYLEEIVEPSGRRAKYGYLEGNLISITYADSTTANPKVSEYEYYGPSGFLTKAHNFDGYQINYAYSNTTNPPYRVTNVSEKNGTSDGGCLAIDYSDHNETKFTDLVNNRAVTYQFNNWGNTLSVLDDKGNANNYKINNLEKSKINNTLSSSGSVNRSVENLISNPSFETDLADWTTGGMGSVSVTTSNAFIGDKMVIATNSDLADDAYSVLCNTSMSALTAGTYTISANFKVSGVDNLDFTGIHGAGIELRIKNAGVTRWGISEFTEKTTDVSVDNGWKRTSLTFTLVAGDVLECIYIGIFNSTGTAYIDGIQLEKGSSMNQYNLVENSSFERNSGINSMPTGWTGSDFTSGADGIVNNYQNVAVPPFEGVYSLKIKGDPTKNKNIFQNIKTKGAEGDVYSLSAFAKADAIQRGGAYNFSICMRIDYTDGIDYKEFEFNSNVSSEQNLSTTFVIDDNNTTTNRSYTQLFIMFCYHANVNTVYLDNLQLYKDVNQSYQYDNSGNLVSTTDAAKQDSAFAYSNDSLSKLANPDGSSYEYIYDTFKRVTTAKSSEGLKYDFTYDSNGNPLTTEIKNNSSSTSIIPGKTYYIRSKVSGKYLNVNNGATTEGTLVKQHTLDRSTAQMWKIVPAGNGYYRFVPQNATNFTLDVVGGSIDNAALMQIYTPNNTDAQKFKLLPNADGSYRILTNKTSDLSCLDVQGSLTYDDVSVMQYTYNGNANQHWYFESTEKVTSSSNWDTPVSNGVYYIRANHSGQYLDIADAAATDGIKTVQTYFSGAKSQQFKLVQGVYPYFKMVPLHCSGMTLGVGGTTEQGHTRISLYTNKTSNDNEQQFKFIATGTTNNAYKIISKIDDVQAFDVAYGSYANGADIISTGGGTGVNKEFIFEKVSDKILSGASYTVDGNYLSSVTDSSGNVAGFSYDTTKGLLSNTTAPGEVASTRTNYTYDPNTDALTSVSKTNGTQTVTNSYSYANDRLDTITHNSFDYKFGYDSWGKTQTVAVKNGALSNTLVTNTYKPNNGLLDTITYGNGNQVSYVYNADYDWVTQLKYNGIAKFYYSYDNSGNLYKKEDLVNSQTTEYFYDFTKRPVRTKNSNGLTLLYNYDSKNRLSSYSNVLNGTTTKTGYIYGDAAVSGQKPGLIYGIKRSDGQNDVQRISFEYDDLSRLKTRTLNLSSDYNTNYAYTEGTNGSASTATTLLSSITNGADSPISYTYDVKGNIRTISENAIQKASYDYDNLSQLVRENNLYINKTITYFYDAGGNITEKSEYAYTTGTLGTPTLVIPYTYTDPIWKDKLTTYNNGANIVYDAIGNPTLLDGRTFTWENGRRLANTTKSGVTSAYKYDDSGIRTQKTVSGITTNYFLNGDRVEIETNGTDTIKYFYDEKGDLFEFNIKNTAYPAGANFYYIRNGQNDITGILDSTGHPVVSYVYDSWGKLISTTGTLATTIGVQNPYRYRGYRYDVETGLYYVTSRYYDPETCRMLNADGQLNPGLIGTNMFAYCNNSPVILQDDTGRRPDVNGGIGRETKKEFQQSVAAMRTKINPNSDFDDALDKNPGKGPSSDKKARESKGIDDKFGKDRAERERQSRELHDRKKSEGKRNDDNFGYGELDEFVEPMLAQVSVLAGALVITFLVVDNITIIGATDDSQIQIVFDFIKNNLPKCWQMG